MNTLENLKGIIITQLDLDSSFSLTEDTDFSQIGLDSLDLVELIMTVEDFYDIEISDEELSEMQTFGDLVKYIDKKGG